MLSLTKFPCWPNFERSAALSKKTSVPRFIGIAPTYITSVQKTTQQHRTVTNATKLDRVPTLPDVTRVAPKPGGWKSSFIHSSGEVKLTVIRVEPSGDCLANFYHNVWGSCMPFAGQGVVETKSKAGDEVAYDLVPQSFLAVPPSDIHRVRNISYDEEFVFFMAQSSWHEYDLIDAKG